METIMIATNKVKAIMYSIGFTPFRGLSNRPHMYLLPACGKSTRLLYINRHILSSVLRGAFVLSHFVTLLDFPFPV